MTARPSKRQQSKRLKLAIRLYSLAFAYLLIANAAHAEVLSRNDIAPPPLPVALAGSSKLACRPVGDCEVCPQHLRNEPACRVYGNRRPVHCIVLDESSLPKQQKHGAPPSGDQIDSADIAEARANAGKPFVKRPPKHPLVELPPRPGKHPHLLEDYVVNDKSGERKEGEAPVKRSHLVFRRDAAIGSEPGQQTFATWEPCTRAIDAERKDYWEFVLCNLGFAALALCIVIVRGRMVAARHYNRLVNLVGFKPLQQLFAGGGQNSELPVRSGSVANSQGV